MDTSDSVVRARQALVAHPLLAKLNTPAAWRIFMAHHVFAVWDFMSLAKRLQQALTCDTLPWMPPAHAAHARFINEIMLAEESDEDGLGGFCSHFTLYNRAMREAGADTAPIDGLMQSLQQGEAPAQAIARWAPSQAAAAFVQHTLHVAQHAPIHVVASVFFHGREDVIPAMFTSLTAHVLHKDASFARLHNYLRRHIDLDGDSHGPLAAELLHSLCAQDAKREHEAQCAAFEALQHRAELWSGIALAIDNHTA